MKLHYFASPGRAAAARSIFEYGNIPYEFVPWTSEEVKNNKERFPFGQLPILEFDDGKVLCQSLAIVQYAAQKAGLIPADPQECSYAYSVVFCLEDIMTGLVSVFQEKDEEVKARKMKDFQEVTLPARTAQMESYFNTFGSPGYCVGNQISFADFCVLSFKEVADSGMFGEKAKAALNTETYKAIENTVKNAKAKAAAENSAASA